MQRIKKNILKGNFYRSHYTKYNNNSLQIKTSFKLLFNKKLSVI